MSTTELTRVIDGEGPTETVTFESLCFPLTFKIDPSAVSPIVICDSDGDEIARARTPFHASIVARSLNASYGPTVRSLPSALMRELRTVRPDLVREF